jgi:hypothetical protein
MVSMSPFVRPSGSVRGVAASAALAFVFSLPLVGCAGSGSNANDPARAIAATNQRLQGTWLLMDFQPEVPLEPMLAQLLSTQLGRLTIQLDGGRVVATGLGVQATRTYRVDDASMDRFKLTLFDDTGVPYESWGDFQGEIIRFQSLTTPWRGTGTFKRVAATSGL